MFTSKKQTVRLHDLQQPLPFGGSLASLVLLIVAALIIIGGIICRFGARTRGAAGAAAEKQTAAAPSLNANVANDHLRQHFDVHFQAHLRNMGVAEDSEEGRRWREHLRNHAEAHARAVAVNANARKAA
jgi:hypothetical protein